VWGVGRGVILDKIGVFKAEIEFWIHVCIVGDVILNVYFDV